jgi:hypothetical protein
MTSVSLGNLCARLGADYEHFAIAREHVKKKAGTEFQSTDASIRENTRQALSFVIVYNDMHAALRAAEALERVGRNFRIAQQRFMSVPVAQLDEPSRFDRLLFDAISADMIIVSYNSPSDFPLTLKKWIGNCLTQKRANESAVMALLSSNERVDTPDSPRYQFLKNSAWAAGADFFAPKPDEKADALMGEFHV